MPHLVTVTSDGKIVKEEIASIPPLKKLQDIVGGYIEMVPYFIEYEGSPCVAFCNENGKIHGLPLNPVATAMWTKVVGRPIPDHLVGSIAIVVGPRSFLRSM